MEELGRHWLAAVHKSLISGNTAHLPFLEKYLRPQADRMVHITPPKTRVKRLQGGGEEEGRGRGG